MKTMFALCVITCVQAAAAQTVTNLQSFIHAASNTFMNWEHLSDRCVTEGCQKADSGTLEEDLRLCQIQYRSLKERITTLVANDPHGAAELSAHIRGMICSADQSDAMYSCAVSLIYTMWLSHPELTAVLVTGALADTSHSMRTQTTLLNVLYNLWRFNRTNVFVDSLTKYTLSQYARNKQEALHLSALTKLIGSASESGVDPIQGQTLIQQRIDHAKDWDVKQRYFLLLHRAGLLTADQQSQLVHALHDQTRPLDLRYFDARELVAEGLVSSNTFRALEREFQDSLHYESTLEKAAPSQTSKE